MCYVCRAAFAGQLEDEFNLLGPDSDLARSAAEAEFGGKVAGLIKFDIMKVHRYGFLLQSLLDQTASGPVANCKYSQRPGVATSMSWLLPCNSSFPGLQGVAC